MSAAVVVGAIIAFVIYVDALFSGMCGTTVHNTVAAPDGRLSAVVFDIDCGATTGFNTQVAIAPAGRKFSADRYPAFLVLGGQHDIDVKWTDKSAMEVTAPRGHKVYKKEPSPEVLLSHIAESPGGSAEQSPRTMRRLAHTITASPSRRLSVVCTRRSSIFDSCEFGRASYPTRSNNPIAAAGLLCLKPLMT